MEFLSKFNILKLLVLTFSFLKVYGFVNLTAAQTPSNSTESTTMYGLTTLIPSSNLSFGVNRSNTSTNVEFSDWGRIANCFRKKIPYFKTFNREFRCAGKELINTFKKVVPCKNCEEYFACLASYNAVKKCAPDPDNASKSASAAAAAAAAECGELSLFQNVEEAVKVGKEGKNCEKKYLCSNNCIYNPKNKSCLKNNCRNRRFQKRSMM